MRADAEGRLVGGAKGRHQDETWLRDRRCCLQECAGPHRLKAKPRNFRFVLDTAIVVSFDPQAGSLRKACRQMGAEDPRS